MEIKITKDTRAIREIEAFVKSESQEGVFYKVEGRINLDIEDWTCTCQAGQNKKKCKHVKEVREEVGL